MERAYPAAQFAGDQKNGGHQDFVAWRAGSQSAQRIPSKTLINQGQYDAIADP
jgi:hypothetical protein